MVFVCNITEKTTFDPVNIAIYIRRSIPAAIPVQDFFSDHVLPALLNEHREHAVFLFLDDDIELVNQSKSTGALTVVRLPAARSAFRQLGWYYVKFPELLKTMRINALVSVNAIMRPGSVRQTVYFENDLALLRSVKTRTLKNVRRLVAGSQWVANRITLPGKAEQNLLEIVPRGLLSGYEEIDGAQRSAVRDAFTAGRNYFLYAGELNHALLNVVRAFSIFKKRQKSEWKLVLTGRGSGPADPFVKSLQHYKYRDDLILVTTPTPAQLRQLVDAAYAMVYTTGQLPLLAAESFYAGVPVIAPDEDVFTRLAGAAAMYYEKSGPTPIAENMMTLYKDENLRARMIAAGRAIAAGYSWTPTVEALIR